MMSVCDCDQHSYISNNFPTKKKKMEARLISESTFSDNQNGTIKVDNQ